MTLQQILIMLLILAPIISNEAYATCKDKDYTCLSKKKEQALLYKPALHYADLGCRNSSSRASANCDWYQDFVEIIKSELNPIVTKRELDIRKSNIDYTFKLKSEMTKREKALNKTIKNLKNQLRSINKDHTKDLNFLRNKHRKEIRSILNKSRLESKKQKENNNKIIMEKDERIKSLENRLNSISKEQTGHFSKLAKALLILIILLIFIGYFIIRDLKKKNRMLMEIHANQILD